MNSFSYHLDADDMLPNLECEVEINEEPDDAPRPIIIKTEKINDVKTNSIEGAKTSLQAKDEQGSSPISSPITDKDKLACDLAEFETDVIGEQLDRKTSDINSLATDEDDEGNVELDITNEELQTPPESPEKSVNGQLTPTKAAEIIEQKDIQNQQRDINSDNGDHTDCQNGENEEAEEITDPDIDTSLLQEEGRIGDDDKLLSDRINDRISNEDAETIKLLNEDDEAFESFLEDEDSSDEMLTANLNKDNETNDNEEQELKQGPSTSRQDTSDIKSPFEPIEQNEEDGLLLENEVYFENEEEEIDDEMEGDED